MAHSMLTLHFPPLVVSPSNVVHTFPLCVLIDARFLDAVATLATLPCCFHVESKVSKCHGYDGYGRVKSGLKILIHVKYLKFHNSGG